MSEQIHIKPPPPVPQGTEIGGALTTEEWINKAIELLRARAERIRVLEQQAAAHSLIQGAMYLIKRWGHTPAWLGAAEQWIARRVP